MIVPMPTDDVDLVVDVMLLTAAAKVGREAVERADRGVDESNTYGLPPGDEMAAILREWFASQRKKVLAKVPKPGDAIPGDLAQLGEDDQALARATAPVIAAQWSSTGKSTYARLGLDPDDWRVASPHLTAKIQQAALSFSASTNATTSKSIDVALTALRAAFLAGVVDEGETLAQLTRRVGEIFEHAETYRARRIAATETSRAVHAAQMQAGVDSGVVAGYEWLVSGDACPLCRKVAAEARRVRLGDDFAVVGTHPEYSHVKHPPLHPGCQCTAVEVLTPEYGGPADPAWSATLVQPKTPKDGYTPPEGVPEPKPNRKKASKRPVAKPRKTPAPPPPTLKPDPPPAPVVAPEPIPVLPPTPPTPPTPQTTPVSRAVDVRIRGELGAKARRALAAIDGVHGAGPLPPIPAESDARMRASGAYTRTVTNRPVSITLNPKGETPILTMIHEVGHFIEGQGVPGVDSRGDRDWASDPVFRDWLAAAEQTDAVKGLRRVRERLAAKHPAATRSKLVEDTLEFIDYLVSPPELWARSYSQRVAVRDGGADVLAELASRQPREGFAGVPTQWSNEDFGRLGEAVDGVLKTMGWVP